MKTCSLSELPTGQSENQSVCPVREHSHGRGAHWGSQAVYRKCRAKSFLRRNCCPPGSQATSPSLCLSEMDAGPWSVLSSQLTVWMQRELRTLTLFMVLGCHDPHAMSSPGQAFTSDDYTHPCAAAVGCLQGRKEPSFLLAASLGRRSHCWPQPCPTLLGIALSPRLSVHVALVWSSSSRSEDLLPSPYWLQQCSLGSADDFALVSPALPGPYPTQALEKRVTSGIAFLHSFQPRY